MSLYDVLGIVSPEEYAKKGRVYTPEEYKELQISKKEQKVEESKEVNAGGGGRGSSGILGGILGYQRVEQEYHEPLEHFAPTITETHALAHYHPRLVFQPTPVYTYTGGDVIIESPGARTKKETQIDVAPRAEISGAIDYPTTTTGSERVGEGDVAGVNLTHIAIVAAVALVSYTVIAKTDIVKKVTKGK